MAAESLFEWFQRLWLFTSFPIYCLVIFTLIKYRHSPDLNHSFYKLLISLGFMDLANMAVKFIGIQSAEWSWFLDFHRWGDADFVKITHILLYGTSIGQHLCVLCIAVNRFTAFMFLLSHETLWTTRRLILVVILEWTLPFVYTAPLWFSDGFNVTIANETVQHNLEENDLTVVHHISSSIIILFVAFCVLLLYGAVFLKACCVFSRAKPGHRVTGRRRRSAGEQLALQTAVIGFTISLTLVLFAFFIIAHRCSLIDQSALNIIFRLVGDLYCGCTPYVLILMCSSVRAKVFDCACIRRNR